MTTVAFATENTEYDGRILEHILRSLLRFDVNLWVTPMRFDGRKAVLKLLPTFLERAIEAGLEHAIVAIDNDGGARSRPAHDPAHCAATEDLDEAEGCSTCVLRSRIPEEWTRARRCCVAVPVQTIETWLLVARGDALTPSPEQIYHRRNLKKRFHGPVQPDLARRVELAQRSLREPDALARLRTLRSFLQFEEQLGDWPRLEGVPATPR